jgi:hypothetical protein
MSTINDSGNFIPRLYSFMPHAADPKPSSDGNPILRDFRRGYHDSFHATVWATKLTAANPPAWWWLLGATVSQQVFAARVLYRYAAVSS